MIENAKKNLLAKLHTLPLDIQADIKTILAALDAADLTNQNDLPCEIWKDVVGYEGFYQVSNLGRVKSFHKNKVKILEPHCDKTSRSYPRVNLCKENCMVKKLVHVLVAEAFIPNPQGKPMVNHKDGNKRNNRVDNLEWVTNSENVRHAFRIGLNRRKKGTDVYNAKFCEDEIKYIRENYIPRDEIFGANAMAKKFGVVKSTILNIIHRKTYPNVI